MRQTAKYQLNLIDSSDPFLPDGLNANTQKIEDVLSQTLTAHEATVSAQITAQNTAIAAIQGNLGIHGHNARLAFGTRAGNGQFGQDHPTVLTFDFCPVLVVMPQQNCTPGVLLRGYSALKFSNAGASEPDSHISWTDHSVSIYNTMHAQYQYNINMVNYPYVAIGYDLD